MTRPVQSTYRVQLRESFGFDDARGVIDHITGLGISHLYTSPVLEATPGSTHGYDVADHRRVRSELGGEEGLRRLVDALRQRDMGWIVDLVPNHVSVAVPRANPRWWDMLKHGRESESATWFDVDWEAGQGRVVLPVLGSPLEGELAAHSLNIRRAGGGPGTVDHQELVIGYHDLDLPIGPGTATIDDLGASSVRVAQIIEAQHYRPVFWRDGGRNYRVFFDIDSLAAIRIEEPEVFDAVHERLRHHVADDLVDGVRIDHVDGLADPAGYLDALQEILGPDRPIWVEKITMSDETIPPSWPVAGTTGYDFARITTGLGVEPTAEEHFDRQWFEWSGDARTYDEHEHAAKREVLAGGLAPDVERLVRVTCNALGAPAEQVRGALVELMVATTVYRTYGVGTTPLSPVDLERLDPALRSARMQRPELAETLDAIAQILREPDPASVEVRIRFQQLTGPAMAKGGEDTATYRYLRFVALNEVGASPSTFGVGPEEYHRQQRHAASAHRPGPMLSGSTHDTKRSADVRSRLAVLSHDPGRWDRFLDQVRAHTQANRPANLDPATELLLWQTVAGSWPISDARLSGYLLKAVREAKTHTTWTDPDEAYETAVTSFAEHVVSAPQVIAALEEVVGWLGPAGRAVRLEEVVLRLTAIGVPDVYQGDQDWDLSLVDPDNRRPVDHAMLAERLGTASNDGDIDACGLEERSLAKLWVTSKLLSLRDAHPDWFTPGVVHDVLAVSAEPLTVVAARHGDAITVVGTGAPSEVQRSAVVDLPPGDWFDVLRPDRPVVSGQTVVGQLWSTVRAAVLVDVAHR